MYLDVRSLRIKSLSNRDTDFRVWGPGMTDRNLGWNDRDRYSWNTLNKSEGHGVRWTDNYFPYCRESCTTTLLSYPIVKISDKWSPGPEPSRHKQFIWDGSNPGVQQVLNDSQSRDVVEIRGWGGLVTERRKQNVRPHKLGSTRVATGGVVGTTTTPVRGSEWTGWRVWTTGDR